MYGDMTSNERELQMSNFRSGQTRCLITTDLLARGIDVSFVSIVISYDCPLNRENYIRRCGRSGVYGRRTNSIIFVTDEDTRELKELETFYNTNIQELPQDALELM